MYVCVCIARCSNCAPTSSHLRSGTLGSRAGLSHVAVSRPQVARTGEFWPISVPQTVLLFRELSSFRRLLLPRTNFAAAIKTGWERTQSVDSRFHFRVSSNLPPTPRPLFLHIDDDSRSVRSAGQKSSATCDLLGICEGNAGHLRS